jgi:glycosyltransferase involved in cell wall biosynthesis
MDNHVSTLAIPRHTARSSPVAHHAPANSTANSTRAGRELRRPTVTVLTPSLNGGEYFNMTLRSVLSQSGDFNLQWIVIDGGSNDGTLSLLKSINDPRVRWISEVDNGQAAAINKGIAMAQGDIIAWLNCDDLYLPGAIQAAVTAFENNPSAQWLVGRCGIVNEEGAPIRHAVTRYKDRLLSSFSFRRLLQINMINQPAVFWRRDFGLSCGPLDESLHYTMDYDLWLRMATRRPPLIVKEVLADFRVHGESKSRKGCREQFDEGYRVASRYWGADYLSRCVHRFNVEKIVWGYRAMRLIGL